MANTKEIQETNEKYSGYDEDHECHVYDFLCKVKKCKAEARKYRAVFLCVTVCNLTTAPSYSGC